MSKFPYRLVILDRDGVINVERGHITSLDNFEIIEGVCEAISKLNQDGVKICVASNQSGLARGILSEDVLLLLQEKFEENLTAMGGWIDQWFYSPWHPDLNLEGGIKKWLGEHEDRKPRAGMLNKALSFAEVDASEALMIGDSCKDAQAAEISKIDFLGIKSAKVNELKKEKVYSNLLELVNNLFDYEG